jgi:hypothetical protein
VPAAQSRHCDRIYLSRLQVRAGKRISRFAAGKVLRGQRSGWHLWRRYPIPGDRDRAIPRLRRQSCGKLTNRPHRFRPCAVAEDGIKSPPWPVFRSEVHRQTNPPSGAECAPRPTAASAEGLRRRSHGSDETSLMGPNKEEVMRRIALVAIAVTVTVGGRCRRLHGIRVRTVQWRRRTDLWN